MNISEYQSLMNTESAAAYLGLKESRLRYEVFLKRIPFVKLGRSVRFSKEQLDKWISENSKGISHG